MDKQKQLDRSYYDECLPTWKHPSSWDSSANFIGIEPGGYSIYSKNRDSTLLETTNFDAVLRELGGETEYVEVVRHRHWACGWIEYIIVDRNAPEKLLDTCVDICRALENHPVLDEDTYTQAQWEAIHDYWLNASMRERIDLCTEVGISIFQARYYDMMPDKIKEHLMNDERFY